jgi:hypothetical protein
MAQERDLIKQVFFLDCGRVGGGGGEWLILEPRRFIF